jgi:hypothetical protein
LTNKAASGNLKAIPQTIQLREKIQKQERFLNPPVFQVNFVKPGEVDCDGNGDDKENEIGMGSLEGSHQCCSGESQGQSKPEPGERGANGPTRFIAGPGHISSHRERASAPPHTLSSIGSE